MNDTRILNGYIVIYRPYSPMAMKSANWKGWVYQHRLVVSEATRKS